MKVNSFIDKVVIITGSSNGIGKELALQLCRAGAKVVINGRSMSKLTIAQDELRLLNCTVFPIQADITKIKDCTNMMNQVIKRYGKIDILINNGSLTMNENIETLHPEIFEEVLKSNIIGTIFPTMAALPYIKKTKGSIIFISSLAGLHGMPSASAYSAGKMSLTALWQSLKIEQSLSGVHFGICYVSFTKNDADKRMLSSNGKLVPVPSRPAFIQQSKIKVAGSIIQLIKKRKSKKTLSVLGIITSILMRHFPRLTLFIFMELNKKAQRKLALIKK